MIIVNEQLLTVSNQDIIPVEVEWKNMSFDKMWSRLMEGSLVWLGVELAYLNSRMIELGIHYC